MLFEPGAAAGLAGELRRLALRRPVLLCSARMAASAKFELIRRQMEAFNVLHIDNIPSHSSVSLIETVAHRAAQFKPDCIVALGGGSVSDSAKGLAMLLAEGGALADHATHFEPPSTVTVPHRVQPKLPIISLPTTASGAEATPSFGISDGHEKLLFWNRSLACTSILIDPDWCDDVPMNILHSTAMNGIAHCLEGLYSRNRSPVSDALAMHGLRFFIKGLVPDKALPEAEQRQALLMAGHMSGMVLSMARSCLHHAICHVIGARHNTGHGAVNTVMLAHTLRFNEPVAGNELAPALDMINGMSAGRYTSVSDWVAQLIETLSLPGRLSQLGITEADLDEIAAGTLAERGLAFNPRPVIHSSDIKSILRNAL
ncbi:iron-containing alcohol dehydrogenase [Pusillimonas sp. SM2304]|uniref:iron-containing alcohol dehydrogenase family protein n=1 Tax=Pusillimonas sp. SM2304 TaxID=3073241 RepID=UPI0028763858|nr:iron-containing alcohol dehydrogenase [Pusillimonas sp. SM2304]MDS1138816.1 iron-containing alcohol dehydrogenase [Pusillimonas sp. SM2304]